MQITRINHFQKNTFFVHQGYWNRNLFAVVLCPDGKLRKTNRISPYTDQMYTSAAVRAKGKTISGHMTIKDDTLVFVPNRDRKNWKVFEHDLVEWIG